MDSEFSKERLLRIESFRLMAMIESEVATAIFDSQEDELGTVESHARSAAWRIGMILEDWSMKMRSIINE